MMPNTPKSYAGKNRPMRMPHPLRPHPAIGRGRGMGGGNRARQGDILHALAMIGARPAGSPSVRDEALARLRGQVPPPAPPTTGPPGSQYGQPLPEGHYDEPPGGYPDGHVPWTSRLPNALTKPGDPAHPMPHVPTPGLDQTRAGMIGHPADQFAHGLPPTGLSEAERMALDRIKARLARRGIRGDVTIQPTPYGNQAVGPRGRAYALGAPGYVA